MLGKMFCHIVGKAAKDGLVLSETKQEFDCMTGSMGKEVWIPCLKWKHERCRKCQTDNDTQLSDEQQPTEFHE